MRERDEGEIELAERDGIERHVLEPGIRRAERRVERTDVGPRVGGRGHVHDVDVGMRREQPQELGPRVP